MEYGIELMVDSVGFIPGKSISHSYILDADRVSGGGLPVPRFAGIIVGRRFALGVASPPSSPFTVDFNSDESARLLIELTWCAKGALFNGSTTYPVEATVRAGLRCFAIND